ncbi:hypothetical protein O6H91_09G091900 [Diphasiastrum complanatum]|uniref:Uncharacterized protein n=1 Tax=Diphasiastrum complanatum TaxID=34168 RepID=A0ACC2CSY6_DIPCM|nr:hypothetical protein O6H91_09G091900 [Diphasiastrum complanatum]
MRNLVTEKLTMDLQSSMMDIDEDLPNSGINKGSEATNADFSAIKQMSPRRKDSLSKLSRKTFLHKRYPEKTQAAFLNKDKNYPGALELQNDSAVDFIEHFPNAHLIRKS